MNQIFFAQKAIILDSTKNKILIIKYVQSQFMPEKVNGKLGLPGGKIEFGEKLDGSLIREVKKETGITITPGEVLHLYTWIYQAGDLQKQIIAAARISQYKSGSIKKPDSQKETKLDKARWIDIKDLNSEDFVIDEQPVIKKFLKFHRNNLTI